jgi:ribosomal protein S18 acetylase RimI-like enzyme
VTMAVINREDPSKVRSVLDELHLVSLPEVEAYTELDGRTGEPIVLLAYEGDRPVGYLVATAPEVGEVELWEHGVHPDFRQRGLGRALLHHLACSCDPGTGLRLDPTGQLDPERAADYYVSCGFRRRDSSGHLWGTAAAVRQATAP